MTARRALALQPHHLVDLRSSGLTDKTIRAAGFRSLTAVEVRQILNGRNVGPGLEIPYPAADGVAAFSRVKPDTPVAGKDGKTAKYLTVSGAGNRLFVPTNIAVGVCDDPTVDLWITEGEKKALKATQEGFPTLGLAGVWSWRTKDPDGLTGPLPEFDGIIWEERTVYIAFDSDLVGNTNVAKAEAGLATELRRRGAYVRLVRLPDGSNGDKVGLDDYLIANGPSGLRALEADALEAHDSLTISQIEHLTDLGNARRLVAEHGLDLRFCFPQGSWYIWDGRHWLRDETAEVVRRAKQTVAGIYVAAGSVTNEDKRKDLGKHATRSEANQKLRAMVELARSEPNIPVLPGDLDRANMLLNVANGTLDLKTSELRGHRRSDLLTRLVDVPFRPNAKCPTWEAFLKRTFLNNANVIGFIRRAVGYSFTGETGEQVLFFLYGTGANGKSTFLNILLFLLGRYGRQIESDLLLVRGGNVHPTGLADLEGTRLAVAMEIEDGRRIAESLVKHLTGGDRLTARRMNQDFREFWPTHKLWLGANHKPKVNGTDNAIWRRILLIPFSSTVPKNEQDRSLPEKLREELPGILAWAVRGCIEWQTEGLGVPDEVRATTESYRAEEDILFGFIENCCVVHPTKTVGSTDLYEAFKEWTGTEITQKALAQRLQEKGFERGRRNTGKYWKGMGLGEPCEPL
jgi:P4 family phage/plasmid primase-like protien